MNLTFSKTNKRWVSETVLATSANAIARVEFVGKASPVVIERSCINDNDKFIGAGMMMNGVAKRMTECNITGMVANKQYIRFAMNTEPKEIIIEFA